MEGSLVHLRHPIPEKQSEDTHTVAILSSDFPQGSRKPSGLQTPRSPQQFWVVLVGDGDGERVALQNTQGKSSGVC